MKKFIFSIILLFSIQQIFLGTNLYAKTYDSYVSLPNSLISKLDINKYNDGDTLNADINGQNLKLVIAKDRETIIRGLSWREKIPFDGMIFFFDKLLKVSFWMKGMNFPLDIVWVRNNVILEVTENVKPEPGVPEEKLKTYSSSGEVDIVIELSAGRAKELKIKEGNILIL
ncbi:MAG: DUF192 domain-containing protein [Endomicrobium sp.]|jgi:uncharacterized membrane protein (UPF0127 family)|nr:DUF192 domain-containing protein [Endomicrobium sp.]